MTNRGRRSEQRRKKMNCDGRWRTEKEDVEQKRKKWKSISFHFVDGVFGPL